MNTPILRREGQAYVFEHQGLRAEFSHLHQEMSGQYGGLNGEVRVTTTLPGTPPHLHEARLNLSSSSGRQGLVKILTKRSGGLLEMDIDDFVEMACVLTIRAFREGTPFMDLAGRAYEPPAFAVASLFPLYKRCQVYAPAENFKTTLMLAFLMDVVTGEPTLGFDVVEGPAAYMDWETDENDAANIWYRLALSRGLDVPPRLIYRRCHLPIWMEAESASAEFSREGVSAVLLDSAFWACGGNPNDQDKVGAMFNGIDALGNVTSILLNHTASSETDKAKRRHYGLEHFRNAVRASWELRKSEEPDSTGLISVGLYRDKLNMRRREGPFGFEIRFDGEDGPIHVNRRDESINEAPDLDASRPAGDRILDELMHGRATLKQLCSALNLPPGTVKSAVFRLKNRVRGHQIGGEYVYELPVLGEVVA